MKRAFPALGRQPKLSEFTPDAQFVGAGILVNGQLSAAKINQNKADFAQQFVNCTDAAKYRCAEFKAIYDGLNNQQYVDKLFQTTGVNASASDRAALVNGLNANPVTETRASVLQKVVDGIVVISEGNQQFTTSYGQAFYDQQFNRAFVQLEYFGYMKRDPDDAERGGSPTVREGFNPADKALPNGRATAPISLAATSYPRKWCWHSSLHPSIERSSVSRSVLKAF